MPQHEKSGGVCLDTIIDMVPAARRLDYLMYGVTDVLFAIQWASDDVDLHSCRPVCHECLSISSKWRFR